MKQKLFQALQRIFHFFGIKPGFPHLNTDRFDKKTLLLNNINLFGFQYKLPHYYKSNRKSYPDQIINSGTAELLIEHFGGVHGQQTNIDNASLGFGLVQYSLIRIFKPEKILCVGSEYGFIPAMCAMACRDNKKGSVDFVDAGKSKGDENSWGGSGFWKRNNPQNHFEAFDLSPYIKPYIMTTKEFAKKHSTKYEYIYLDGDHSYPGIKHDFKKFWPRLTEQGLMILHDITIKGLEDGHEYGVWKLWDQLKEQLPTLSLPGFDNSLGIIQKSGNKSPKLV